MEQNQRQKCQAIGPVNPMAEGGQTVDGRPLVAGQTPLGQVVTQGRSQGPLVANVFYIDRVGLLPGPVARRRLCRRMCRMVWGERFTPRPLR